MQYPHMYQVQDHAVYNSTFARCFRLVSVAAVQLADHGGCHLHGALLGDTTDTCECIPGHTAEEGHVSCAMSQVKGEERVLGCARASSDQILERNVHRKRSRALGGGGGVTQSCG